MTGEDAFVGRGRELAVLRRRLDQAIGGRGSLVVVVGEPGIGKSRLAAAATRMAEGMGLARAWGRCTEVDGAPPYWPWTQVLRQLGRGDGTDDGITPARPDGPVTDRSRTFVSVERALRGAARDHSVVVVLDDLQWADDDSLTLLRFLAPVVEDLPLVLLAAYRDTDLVPGHALLDLTEQLVGRDSVELVTLSGLDEAELEELVGHHGSGMLVADLAARSGGNPFFATQLLRAASDDVPGAVDAAIRGRLRGLPPTARGVLECAAVAGREIEVRVLVGATRRTRDEVVGSIEAACARGLAQPDDRDDADYRFVHDLVRQALGSAIEPDRRLGLHQELARTFDELARDDPIRAVAAAHHACAAVHDPASGTWASHRARAAGEAAAALAADDTAAGWYARAAALLPRDDPARIEVLLAQSEAARRAGDLRQARDALEQAWPLADRSADRPRAASLALALGRVVEPSGKPDPALRHVLESAQATLPPDRPDLDVALTARRAVERYWDDVSEARRLAERATEQATALGVPEVLAAALSALHYVLRGPRHLDRRVAVGKELIDLTRRLGDVERELDAHRVAFSDCLQLGPCEADREMQALDELHRRTRRPITSCYATLFRAIRSTIAGRSQEALHLLAEAESLGQRLGLRSAALFVTTQRFLVLRDLGRAPEHEDALRRMVERFPNVAGVRCQLVLLLADRGRRSEASALLDELTADACSALDQDLTWLACVASLAESAALLDDPRTGELYTLLAPHAGRIAEAGPAGWCGAVDRQLGMAAGVLGLWSEAESHFGTALRVHERWGAVPLMAATLAGHARMLRRRNGPGDRSRAAGLEGEASALTGRHVGPAPSRGAPELTRRENEVLHLLARGSSNKDIARELVLSVHTVERHVANIYAKVGVRNRAGAVAYSLGPHTMP